MCLCHKWWLSSITICNCMWKMCEKWINLVILNLVSDCTCIDACLSYHSDCYPTLDFHLSHTQKRCSCVYLLLEKQRVDMLHTWRLNLCTEMGATEKEIERDRSSEREGKERKEYEHSEDNANIHIFKPLFLMSTTYSIYMLASHIDVWFTSIFIFGTNWPWILVILHLCMSVLVYFGLSIL